MFNLMPSSLGIDMLYAYLGLIGLMGIGAKGLYKARKPTKNPLNWGYIQYIMDGG
jgi:hypothetical protein